MQAKNVAADVTSARRQCLRRDTEGGRNAEGHASTV